MSENEQVLVEGDSQQAHEDLYTQRLNKLNKLVEAGIDPYGRRVDGITSCVEVKALWPTLGEGEERRVRVAGRMTARRIWAIPVCS